MARVDYHVHAKGGLTLEDALRRSRESGIFYGIAINGGLGQPADSDAALEAFLREMEGRPAYKALQAEGREWVRMFSQAKVEKFDYVFTDAMTWTDDARQAHAPVDPRRGRHHRGSPALHGHCWSIGRVGIFEQRADRHLRQPDLPPRPAGRPSTTRSGRRRA